MSKLNSSATTTDGAKRQTDEAGTNHCSYWRKWNPAPIGELAPHRLSEIEVAVAFVLGLPAWRTSPYPPANIALPRNWLRSDFSGPLQNHPASQPP